MLEVFFCLFVYFLPALAARVRKNRYAGPIAVVNAFFGWTMIGWIVALFWAVWPQDQV
jgi:hypothetical protein